MTCFYPLKGYRHPNGTIKFAAHGGIYTPVEVGCKQCCGCRLRHSVDWAARCMHENSLHFMSSFVTLTYDDEKLWRTSLDYRDFQLFMKRLRKELAFFDVTLWTWLPRFYMCGEYGDITRRPHFHVLLFGLYFSDRVFYGRSGSGAQLYTSAMLDDIWANGRAWIGDVTFESAAYVARYCMKKITGTAAATHYEAVDGLTGEILQLEPEFNSMSLKPGIGKAWYDKYGKELALHDSVVINGREIPVPRYYDELLKKIDPIHYDMIAFHRTEKVDFADNTAARLAVKEAVTKARLFLKKRSLQ